MPKNTRGRGGGRGRGRGGNRGKGGGHRDQRVETRGNVRWDLGDAAGAAWIEHMSDLRNDPFESFYLDQGIIPASEWPDFMKALRSPLPTTFRITSGMTTTSALKRAMHETYLPFLQDVEFEGEKVPPPRPMPWYPQGLGWQVDVRKGALRKTPQFKKFQQFLVHETDVGSISRQEAVSMIPPLFLDVQPHHIVLDMCAAPGSKTAQLIEALHSPFSDSPEKYDPCPPGMIIANDSDTKRAHMLVHQATRLPSPNFCVTNYDASAWPNLKVPYTPAQAAAGQSDQPRIESRNLLFDRILADVPCSGDGTMRKNMPIWKNWTGYNGTSLHQLQLNILMKGLSTLRPGGRLVYSTCSMNPAENEAVVAAALRLSGANKETGEQGKVHLVDESAHIPELIRRPGMHTWKVAASNKNKKADSLVPAVDKAAGPIRFGLWREADEAAKEAQEEKQAEDDVKAEGSEAAGASTTDAPTPQPGEAAYRDRLPSHIFSASWEELKAQEPETAARLPKSLWPQGDGEFLHLERCLRVYPHLQNTGGFFVAVLEKAGDPDAEGMAAGMVRAIDALDARPDAAPAEQAVPAAPEGSGTGAKRALDDDAQSDEAEKEGPTKRAKTEAGEASDVAKSSEPLDPVAEAKAKAKARQMATDAGYGLSGGLPFKEDPFVYIAPDNEQIDTVIDFFGIKPEFPRRNLMVRNKDGQPLRSVYLTSTSVRALLSWGGPGVNGHPTLNPMRMRLLNCGVKTLARQESGKDVNLVCRWRAAADGCIVLRPFLDDSAVLKGRLDELKVLLAKYYPFFDDLPDGQLKDAIKARPLGSIIVDVLPGESEGGTLDTTITVPLWRAVTSINLMLDKQEKSALSHRIFGTDLSRPDGERFFAPTKGSKQQAKRTAAAAAGAGSGTSTPAQDDDEDALMERENEMLAAAQAAATGAPQLEAGASQEEGK